jgi:hypothetical protein
VKKAIVEKEAAKKAIIEMVVIKALVKEAVVRNANSIPGSNEVSYILFDYLAPTIYLLFISCFLWICHGSSRRLLEDNKIYQTK